jgi:arylsulfatase
MGMIDDRFVMTPPGAEVRNWTEITDDERAHEDLRMAAYAGMVDRLDQNVGRLMEHLADQQLLENTVILFLSDNGGDYGGGSIQTWTEQVPWLPGSHMTGSNGWASLKNTPFRFYKNALNQGGVAAPLIVRWPDGIRVPAGTILHQRVHVTDLYPTLLDVAGVDLPELQKGKELEPVFGRSIVPVFRDSQIEQYALHDEIFWEFRQQSSRGTVQGDWKLASYEGGAWQLYNLASDPAESRDLAMELPEKVDAMVDVAANFASQHTLDIGYWALPVSTEPSGWGTSRLRRFVRITDTTPGVSAHDVPLDISLTLEFDLEVDFNQTEGKGIRLYAVGAPDKPVWKEDPNRDHPDHGKRVITFGNIPRLEPDTTYYVVSDTGWARIDGEPLLGINDGSFALRFRTVSAD